MFDARRPFGWLFLLLLALGWFQRKRFPPRRSRIPCIAPMELRRRDAADFMAGVYYRGAGGGGGRKYECHARGGRCVVCGFGFERKRNSREYGLYGRLPTGRWHRENRVLGGSDEFSDDNIGGADDTGGEQLGFADGDAAVREYGAGGQGERCGGGSPQRGPRRSLAPSSLRWRLACQRR